MSSDFFKSQDAAAHNWLKALPTASRHTAVMTNPMAALSETSQEPDSEIKPSMSSSAALSKIFCAVFCKAEFLDEESVTRNWSATLAEISGNFGSKPKASDASATNFESPVKVFESASHWPSAFVCKILSATSATRVFSKSAIFVKTPGRTIDSHMMKSLQSDSNFARAGGSDEFMDRSVAIAAMIFGCNSFVRALVSKYKPNWLE